MVATDTVSFAIPSNTAPVSDAGLDVTVRSGDPVTLRASTRDSDGDGVTYEWNQTSGTGVWISNHYSKVLSFNAPIVTSGNSTLVFEFITTDGQSTHTDDVSVVVLNKAPVADASTTSEKLSVGQNTRLDAYYSYDDPGSTLTYVWEQISGTSVNITSTNHAHISQFKAPAVAGNLVFQLTVSDGELTDTERITIIVADNRRPNAEAGVDQTVSSSQRITLDGSSSSDPDNDTLRYTWEQTAGDTLSFSKTSVTSEITIPAMANNVYSFRLTVTDGFFVDSDETNVYVVQENQPPLISITGEVIKSCRLLLLG